MHNWQHCLRSQACKGQLVLHRSLLFVVPCLEGLEQLPGTIQTTFNLTSVRVTAKPDLIRAVLPSLGHAV